VPKSTNESRVHYTTEPARGQGLSCGVVCVILSLATSVETWTCDRQTDRQTHNYGL